MASILIVDDERDIVDYLVEELQDEGWETGGAYDGVEAVLKILSGGWDALLMDIRMPRLDGISALKIIRRLEPDLPVLMFTGQAGKGEISESVNLGAFTCLPKPMRMEKLVATIEQMLDHGRRVNGDS